MSRTFFGAVDELASQEIRKPGLLTVGGGEGTLRWLLVPSISTLREMDPPVHCQIRNLKSADIIRELELGRIDVGIVRKTAVPETLSFEPIGYLHFTLVIPRRLLRSRSGDEAYEGKPLPYAELAGDGQLATIARDIAGTAGIRLNTVLRAETLSLLLAAVEHQDAAAFLPVAATATLPNDRFALLQIENIHRLSRETVIAWSTEAADHKPALKRSLRVLGRSLKQALADSSTSSRPHISHPC